MGFYIGPLATIQSSSWNSKLSRQNLPQFLNVRNYKNYSPNLFMVDLADKADDLLTIFDASDVDTKLNTFNDTLQSVLDIHAPMKSIKILSRPRRFVSKDIKDLMKSRDGLLKRFH